MNIDNQETKNTPGMAFGGFDQKVLSMQSDDDNFTANGGIGQPRAAETLREAQRLASMGYPVFALKPGNKKPFDGSNGCKDATTDSAKIRQWFVNRPCNIGLHCAGLVVIDIDCKDAKHLADALRDYDDGICPMQRTRSGGFHLVYRKPAGLEVNNSAGKIRAGIDVRTDGGYIVAAPSFVEADEKATGGFYSWERPLVSLDLLTDPPQQFLDDLATSQAKKTQSVSVRPTTDLLYNDDTTLIDRAGKYLAKMPEAIAGQGGHDRTLEAARVLVHDFAIEPDAAFQLLWKDYNPRCQPPWSERELLHKVSEAVKLGGDKPRGRLAERKQSNGFSENGKTTGLGRQTDKVPADIPAVESNTEPEPPEPFPIDVLPDVLKDFAVEGAKSHGSDVAFFAPAMLSAVSGVMGTSFRVKIKDGYFIYPAIWTVVIAPSGGGKSPALQKVMAPIICRQVEFDKDYNSRLRAWRAEFRVWENLKKNGKATTDAPVQPVPKQIRVDDATMESLAMVLEQNREGVVQYVDEMQGFFARLDAYRPDSVGKDQAAYLSIFSNNPLRINRKTGIPIISADKPSVAICGGIQPDVLKDILLKNPGYFQSGFAARFLWSQPPDKPVLLNENTMPFHVTERYGNLLNRIIDLRQTVCEADPLPEFLSPSPETETWSGRNTGEWNHTAKWPTPDNPMTFELSPKAYDLFFAYFNATAHEMVNCKADAGRASFSKLRDYAAKIAVVFHLAEHIDNGYAVWPEYRHDAIPRHISEKTMAAAIQVTNWHKGETVRILATVTGSGKVVNAGDETRILEAIQTIETRDKGTNEATAYEIRRLIRLYLKPGGDAALEQKLSEMVSAGIIKSCYTQTDKGGHGKTVYQIRPYVAVTGGVATVAVAVTPVFPEENDSYSNSNNHNAGETATWKPTSVTLQLPNTPKLTEQEAQNPLSEIQEAQNNFEHLELKSDCTETQQHDHSRKPDICDSKNEQEAQNSLYTSNFEHLEHLADSQPEILNNVLNSKNAGTDSFGRCKVKAQRRPRAAVQPEQPEVNHAKNLFD